MRKINALVAAGALAAGLAHATPGAAQTVRYDFDSSADLVRDGFGFNTSGGMPEFASGIMRLRSTGFSEWDLTQMATSARWIKATSSAPGWWVEFRLQVSAADCEPFPPPEPSLSGGPGIWAQDDKMLVKLQVVDGLAGLSYPELHGVTLDTKTFHVYRLAKLGAKHVQVVIDGKIVIDEPALRVVYNGPAAMLDFGDLGGCHSSDSSWDYLSYDTVAPPAVPGDADGDGVDNAIDNCALVVNPTQTDADKDGIGNDCDPCPTDPDNDADEDGLCGDVDPCPMDARNDTNKNGMCDTAECAAARPPNCPSICNCGTGGFIGIDPVWTGGAPSGNGGRAGGAGGTLGASGSLGAGGNPGGHNSGSGGAAGGGGTPGTGAIGGNGDPAAGGAQFGDAPFANPVRGSGDSGGCGCSVPGRAGSGAAGLATLLAAFGLRTRRRRSRRHGSDAPCGTAATRHS
jgi:MYXO-CTERM domain-containing protein